MNNRKPTFFTSDWHVGHFNILKFCDRPFQDLDAMHKYLIKNYNAVVPYNGICYFLGDMGRAKASILNSVYKHLHGTKVAIIGNHDPGVNALYDAGFDVVMHGVNLIIAKELVTLRHCPLRGILREKMDGMQGVKKGDHWYGESRPKHNILSANDNGQFHLHGHIHSPNKGRSKKICGKQYDVGVDANKYKPVSISTIESWIALTKREENDTNS